jgi:hypothetical protein
VSGANALTPYWIGLTDHDVDGDYRWVNGDTFDYQNWNPQEPNNLRGDEDYIAINWHKNHGRSNSQFGDWNDAPIRGTSGGFWNAPENYLGIMEFESRPPGLGGVLYAFDGPFEPDADDQRDEAQNLGPVTGVTSADSVILSAKDVSIYKFSVAAGQSVLFDIDTPTNAEPGLDAYVRVFDGGGEQLAANDDGIAPGDPALSGSDPDGLDSYLTYNFAAAGDYYVGVSAYGNLGYDLLTGGGDSAGSNPTTGSFRLILSTAVEPDSGVATPGVVTPPAGFFAAGTRLIDFDTAPDGQPLPPGTSVRDQYGSSGVRFSVFGGPSSRELRTSFRTPDPISGTNSLIAYHESHNQTNSPVTVAIDFDVSALDGLPLTAGFVFTDSAPNNPFTARAVSSWTRSPSTPPTAPRRPWGTPRTRSSASNRAGVSRGSSTRRRSCWGRASTGSRSTICSLRFQRLAHQPSTEIFNCDYLFAKGKPTGSVKDTQAEVTADIKLTS